MNEKDEQNQQPNTPEEKRPDSASGCAAPLQKATLEEIVTDNYTFLLKYATTRTGGNVTLAEELVQEAFLELVKRQDRLIPSEPHKLRAWLVKVLRYRSIDMRRRRLLSFESLTAEPSSSYPVETIDALDAMRNALSELSMHEREIFTLYFFQEMSIAEIAHRFSVSMTLVKSRLYRTRSRLSEILGLKAAPAEANTQIKSPVTPLAFGHASGRFEQIAQTTPLGFNEDDPKEDDRSEEEAVPATAIEQSKAAYRAELPELLKTNPRQWVAYADGTRVRIGASQRELYRYCLEDLKLTHDRFIVRRIIPESSPDIEVILR